MSRFGPNPRTFFDDVYQRPAPWDIGGAQPALLTLFDEIPPAGPVLDLGCGSGDLALALAARGLDVTGVDFAERAITIARERAAQARPDVAPRVRFDVGDARHPSTLDGRFESIVDSGFFHLFDQPTRDALAVDLAAALPSGGRYYLLAFAVEFDMPCTPLKVTMAEVTARFAPAHGWSIRTLRPAEFATRLAPVPAVVACLERRSG